MNSSTDESNKFDTALCVTSEDDRIDLQEFLDFLILAYRINDVLTLDKETQIDDTNIDWTEISRNSLFLRLSDKKYDTDNRAEEMSRSKKIERVQSVLKHKLKDIMNEGILDSVLPFIVKKTLTINVIKSFESVQGPKINNSSNKDRTCSKQKCNATDNLSRSKGE